jgi:hypothetical protein
MIGARGWRLRISSSAANTWLVTGDRSPTPSVPPSAASSTSGWTSRVKASLRGRQAGRLPEVRHGADGCQTQRGRRSREESGAHANGRGGPGRWAGHGDAGWRHPQRRPSRQACLGGRGHDPVTSRRGP